jgi:hypothetical protein
MMHLSDRRFTHHEGAGESFCVFRRSQKDCLATRGLSSQSKQKARNLYAQITLTEPWLTSHGFFLLRRRRTCMDCKPKSPTGRKNFAPGYPVKRPLTPRAG